MFRVIGDLFLAGSETTSGALDWAFLFMTEFPEVQKKCQEELDRVWKTLNCIFLPGQTTVLHSYVITYYTISSLLRIRTGSVNCRVYNTKPEIPG